MSMMTKIKVRRVKARGDFDDLGMSVTSVFAKDQKQPLSGGQ